MSFDDLHRYIYSNTSYSFRLTALGLGNSAYVLLDSTNNNFIPTVRKSDTSWFHLLPQTSIKSEHMLNYKSQHQKVCLCVIYICVSFANPVLLSATLF
jgi:hypothetical protein